jgi:hypothetical protein
VGVTDTHVVPFRNVVLAVAVLCCLLEDEQTNIVNYYLLTGEVVLTSAKSGQAL